MNDIDIWSMNDDEISDAINEKKTKVEAILKIVICGEDDLPEQAKFLLQRKSDILDVLL